MIEVSAPVAQYHVATASQYTHLAVSACTPCAIEAGLIILAGGVSNAQLADRAVAMGRRYRNEQHPYADDVLQFVPRYRVALTQGAVNQFTLSNLKELMVELQRNKRARAVSRVVALLIKPPETLLVALLETEQINRWVLFDSHSRMGQEGAVSVMSVYVACDLIWLRASPCFVTLIGVYMSAVP
jgi:hypothetical protein